ncbi:Mini-chromosome maintenance complex-binding protein [Hypsibius exemplaris]|uniref:Mini-chromosome maintenance complex-binding protein n=1 Tax=Hypsibius exemplaris TaxID=2072580 RepID=A0A1W0WM89_HYPEX|nr:Mini-chromosome maintenance complex-binding protein [Hypsibius exemplaris]
MPVQTTPDWVSNPLNIVDKIFANDSTGYQQDATMLRAAVEAAFLGRIKSDTSDYRHLVPLINGLSKEQLQAIPTNSLVRFRCMVRDERPSSYHQGFLQVRQLNSGDIKAVCAMFRDGVVLEMGEQVVAFGERGALSEMRSLKCVSLPVESAWSRAIHEHGKSTSDKPLDPSQPVLVANFFAEAGASVAVNDAVELFGLLSFDDPMLPSPERGAGDSPAISAFPVQHDEMRLNVLLYEDLLHTHPALPLDKTRILSMSREDGFSFVRVRESLMELLKFCLNGDALGAEYLLLHLISSIYARADDQAIGNFPLNLTGMPQDVTFVKRLLGTLENILTQLAVFPMSIATLNSALMAPKMTEVPGTIDNELLPGLLQLPKHTHLALDELGMDTGTLNDTGCRNLLALQKLVSDQKLDFNFLFGQTIPFLMDIPVLVLSQGKSLVNCRCIVPLSPNGAAVDCAALDEEIIWQIRQYLVTVRFLDYEIPPEMREAIVNKFVTSRKADRSISPDDLHQQLELARYMTISHGEVVLTQQRWDEVLHLESERSRRLKETGIR